MTEKLLQVVGEWKCGRGWHHWECLVCHTDKYVQYPCNVASLQWVNATTYRYVQQGPWHTERSCRRCLLMGSVA